MTYQPPLNGKRISLKADANSAIETGVITLASGSNVTLDQTGSTITIDSATEALAGDIEAVGSIKMFAGSSAPTGWLLCDGSAISRATYADLFGIVGTTYGSGNGSTTFNLPNLKGRVPVGYDSGQTEFDTLGETGGAKTHTLTSSEMPSHTHTQDSHNHTQDAHTHTQNSHNHTQDAHTHTQNSHNHTQDSHNHTQDAHQHSVSLAKAAGGNAAYFLVSGSGNVDGTTFWTGGFAASTTATNQATTATNQNTGGDGAHNNLQPYIVVNYIIKAVSAAVGTGTSVPLATVATQTTDYSIDFDDAVVLADASSNNVTLTLPLASGSAGRTFYVKRIDSSSSYDLTIACSGSDTVDGDASVSMPDQWSVMGLVCDGTAWYIL